MSQGSGVIINTFAKKNIDKSKYIFRNKQNEKLVKNPGEIDGKDFCIDSLTKCDVVLMDFTAQITVDDCKDCEIMTGPVNGSIYFRDCTDIIASVACAQFRCRDCKNCTFFVYCSSQPSIESSTGLTFAPYNLSYPHLSEHFLSSGLNPSQNFWKEIHDFTPSEDTVGSPHYGFMEPELYCKREQQVEGSSDPMESVVDIPKKYGGTIEEYMEPNYEDVSGDKDMGLATSKQEAAAQMEALRMGVDNVHITDQPLAQGPDDDETDLFQNYAALGTDNPPTDQYVPPDWGTSELRGGMFGNTNMGGGPEVMGQGGLDLQEINPRIMDPEELAVIKKREEAERERMQKLLEKQDEERRDKEQRRVQAKTDLDEWMRKKHMDIEARKKRNKEEEWAFKEARKAQQVSHNPYEKVITNIEIKEGSYPGKADVSRMRKVIQMRKNDFDTGLAKAE